MRLAAGENVTTGRRWRLAMVVKEEEGVELIGHQLAGEVPGVMLVAVALGERGVAWEVMKTAGGETRGKVGGEDDRKRTGGLPRERAGGRSLVIVMDGEGKGEEVRRNGGEGVMMVMKRPGRKRVGGVKAVEVQEIEETTGE